MTDTPRAAQIDQALLDVVLAQRNSALNEAARQTARAIVAEAERDELKATTADPASRPAAVAQVESTEPLV